MRIILTLSLILWAAQAEAFNPMKRVDVELKIASVISTPGEDWRNMATTSASQDPSSGNITPAGFKLSYSVLGIAGTNFEDYYEDGENILAWVQGYSGQPGTYPCPTDYLGVDAIFHTWDVTNVDPVWLQYRGSGRTATGALAHLMEPDSACFITVDSVGPNGPEWGGRLSMRVRSDAVELLTNREAQACSAMEGQAMLVGGHFAPAGTFVVDCTCADVNSGGNIRLQCDHRVAVTWVPPGVFDDYYYTDIPASYTKPALGFSCQAEADALKVDWLDEHAAGNYGTAMVVERYGAFESNDQTVEAHVNVFCSTVY